MSSRGFSLLELLVAIALLATVSALAYSALVAVQRTNERAASELSQIRQMQLAMHAMAEDISMIVDRPVNRGFDVARPAVVGFDDALEFTRGSEIDPVVEFAATLSRVSYHLDAGRLLRRSRFALDTVEGEQFASQQVQLSGVTSLAARYLGAEGGWSPHWDGRFRELPKAIEIELTIAGIGTVRRLFLVRS